MPIDSALSFLTEVDVPGKDAAWKLRTAALAADAQAYRYTATFKPKEKPKTPSLESLAFVAAANDPKIQRALTEAAAIAKGVRFARELGNLPPNICNPAYIAEQAKKIADEHAGVTLEVLDRDAMQKLGMGSLLGVSQGSANAPKLVVLRWNGGKDKEKPYALVGKGITFDSGGISLKPGAGMEEMKFDMCGGAGVLGAFVAAVELKLPLNIVCIVPAVENMPDGNAYRPSDILTSMSGLTIEVLNTDAEGRLILCDALTYAQKFDPQVIIDAATLTGACVVALGKYASGLMTKDDALADELLKAGNDTHGPRLAPAALGRLPAAARIGLRRRREHRRQVRRRDHGRLFSLALRQRHALGASGHRRYRVGRRPQRPRDRSAGAAADAVPDRSLRVTRAAADYRRQKQIALTTLIGASLVLGIVDAALQLQTSSGLTFVGSLAMLIIGFRWLTLDSAELDIRRPMWLNIGIVMAAIIFVPYYLYKTRPAGHRLPAIASFFAIVLACAMTSAIGAAVMMYFSGTMPAPAPG